MSDGFYLDNDVVLKSCTYGAGDKLIELCTGDDGPPAILALAPFTLRSRVERSKTLINVNEAKANLDTLLAQVRLLEPSPEEIDIAADLEAGATAANLSFDAGESQLVAMLLRRGGVAFVTGDKRAVKAINVVLPTLVEKLVCFEQVLRAIVERYGLDPLRTAVCRERASDRAISICFQCSSGSVDASSVMEGLASYANALRAETGDLLVATLEGLSSEVS